MELILACLHHSKELIIHYYFLTMLVSLQDPKQLLLFASTRASMQVSSYDHAASELAAPRGRSQIERSNFKITPSNLSSHASRRPIFLSRFYHSA